MSNSPFTEGFLKRAEQLKVSKQEMDQVIKLADGLFGALGKGLSAFGNTFSNSFNTNTPLTFVPGAIRPENTIWNRFRNSKLMSAIMGGPNEHGQIINRENNLGGIRAGMNQMRANNPNMNITYDNPYDPSTVHMTPKVPAAQPNKPPQEPATEGNNSQSFGRVL